MEQKSTGGLPPHMWRHIGAPEKAINRRPRGSVSSGQLITWIAILVVVVVLIFLAVGLMSPNENSDASSAEPQTEQTESSANESSNSD